MSNVQSEAVFDESPARGQGQQLCGGGGLREQLVVGGQRDKRCCDHLT